MSDDQLEHVIERVAAIVAERVAKPTKQPLDHLREWAIVIVALGGVVAGYGRLSQRQDTAEVAIVELKQNKADREVLVLALENQNRTLKEMRDDIREIKQLSYPPSFTAFAPGTKLNARRH
jgi:hypothetical protein